MTAVANSHACCYGEAMKVAHDPQVAAGRLAPVLKALGDENRLAILLTLVQGPCSVIELTTSLGIGQTLVSHHLKVLRDVGLVTSTAVGRSNVYELCCSAVAEPVRYLAGVAGLAIDPSSTSQIGA
jgi:DNA-binding transcriptional ArsR family regulator